MTIAEDDSSLRKKIYFHRKSHTKMNLSASKSLLLLLIFMVLFTNCSSQVKESREQTWTISKQEDFTFNSSIRALEVVDENVVWFAGSGGQYGYTKDGGAIWHLDSIRTDTIIPHFRSIAVTDKAVYLLCIASPALLYKSEDWGDSWKIVHREDHPDVFFDAMSFWDDQEGIAMGDPIEGCLSILITRNGGTTWNRIPCSELPSAEDGEAAFAASNSNIALFGNHAWIVSGGKRARVFHSPDRGKTWEVFNTPIIEGGQMTGIFSVSFLDDKNGVIIGGDWNKKEQNTMNKARTEDGGRTWVLIADGKEPGYRSEIRYLPGGKGKRVIAAGIPGVSISNDGGDSWQKLSDESFYTIGSSDGNILWLAGDRKVSRMQITNHK